MITLNRVQLIGNVGKDPTYRQFSSGSLSVLYVATNYFRRTPDGSSSKEVEWHRVVFWGKLADFVANYVKKGMPVFVEGSLRRRSLEIQGRSVRIAEILGRMIIIFAPVSTEVAVAEEDIEELPLPDDLFEEDLPY